MNYETYVLSKDVETILKWFDNKKISIPAIQRNFIWDSKQQSLFIDSILNGFPIPPLYFFRRESKRSASPNITTDPYFIVDGWQRVNTLKKFKNNDLRLKLDNDSLNDKKYDDLSKEQQEIFNEYTITIYDVRAEEEDRIELMCTLFSRLNTGGTRLDSLTILMLSLALSLDEKENDELDKQLETYKKMPDEFLNELNSINHDFNFDFKFSLFTLFGLCFSILAGKEGIFFENSFKEAVKKSVSTYKEQLEIIPDILNNIKVTFKILIEVLTNLINKNLNSYPDSKGKKLKEQEFIVCLTLIYFLKYDKKLDDSEILKSMNNLIQQDFFTNFINNNRVDIQRTKYSKAVTIQSFEFLGLFQG